MIPALIFYGVLAALALWATQRDEDLCWVGRWIAAGYVMSNALYFFASVTSRPGPYTVVEILIAIAAYCAWGITGYRLLVVLVAFNLASIGVNISFAAVGPEPTRYQIYLFVLGTNVCFAAECLLALSVGIAHGYRTGRFHRGFPLRWRAPQSNAAREGEEG